MKLDFKVEGVEETVRALKLLNSDRDTRAIVLAAMRKGAKPIKDEFKNQVDSVPGLKDRADTSEIKNSISTRAAPKRQGKTITLIIGMKKPKEGGLRWYQRLIELGTSRLNVLPFFPLYRAGKIRGKEAARLTEASFFEKFNARMKRLGFPQLVK